MATTSIPGGGDHNLTVYGNGTVIAGNGNIGINGLRNANVIVGSGRDTVNIAGSGTINAGSGNDRLSIGGIGYMTVGGGNDSLTLYRSGGIVETGASGHDTINLGTGSDTIYVQGNATVGSINSRASNFHGATIAGGELKVSHVGAMNTETAVSGHITLTGGASATEFIGGTGSVVMRGGTRSDTFVGGSGHDTMTGGSGRNLFEFLASQAGGQHVITNFVSGDQINVEGHSLDYLLAHHEVSTNGGNTYINVDGGQTTIELEGVNESALTPRAPGYKHEPFDRR